jgi:transposase
MNTRDITIGYRQQHWADIIHECKGSGLSVRAYCVNAGIHENTYYYWQKKLREAACEELALKQGDATNLISARFAEVKLARQSSLSPSMTVSQSQICIEAAGIRIAASGEYPTDKLAALMRELRRPC